jgi:hypothetical protein
MSCANKTYSSIVIGMQCPARSFSSPATPPDYVGKTEPATQRQRSLVPGGFGPTANESESPKYPHQLSSRFIPDSTHTEPEYVWGDEGLMTVRETP